MSKFSTPKDKPLYRRVWLVAPLAGLATAWTVVTFLLPSFQDDLVPAHRTWTVMGTILEATVYRPAPASVLARADLEAAHRAVLKIDQLMSLYRSDSELVALNTQAGAGPIEISAATFQVLQASQHYTRLSGGAFDVTVQPLVQLWGFYKMERNSIPSTAEIQAVLGHVGADRLELNGLAGTAALAAGSRLDLGSIAKGYAIDQAIAVLRARGVPAALVDLGGNIGVLGQPPGGRPWAVGVKHPREDGLIGLLRLKEGAIATSGDYDRYFEVEGQRVSHLLDPRTGLPAEGLYAVTVAAPNATTADALSTAAFVLGAEQGMALLSGCEDVEGLLIQPLEKEAQGGRDSADRVVIQTTLSSGEEAVSFVLESGADTVLGAAAEETEPSSIPECVWPLGSQLD